MATIPETCLPLAAAVDRAQVAIVVPTYNARKHWASLSDGLRLQGLPANQILIIDSSSNDGTRELAAGEGYGVFRIDHNDFNHGGTRQLAVELVPWANIVVYLTQDAILATPDSLDHLLAAFLDRDVAAAYGRQLPRPGAGPIEAHARLFNYPPQSAVRNLESRDTLGIKATFMSNSFSAYRTHELKEVGGFPADVIMTEDAILAGKLLLAGWQTAYVAEAAVYHSHTFTIGEEFRRYFDIGVSHRQANWLRERFGDPSGEGKRFVISELRYLTPHHLHLVPYALLRTASKAIGYQLGFRKSFLGVEWSRRFSYHKSYWDNLKHPR